MTGTPPASNRFPRRWFFLVLVAAFFFVHLRLEIEFWFHGTADPFGKFAGESGEPIEEIALQAYLAKSAWFLLTILLFALGVPCHLAFGIGAIVYGLELLWFFDSPRFAWGCAGLGVLILAEEWVRRDRSRRRVRTGR